MKRIFLMIALLSGSILSANAQNAKADFNKALTAYFNTKNALAGDNAALAATSAKALNTSLAAFKVKDLTTAQQAVWTAQTAEIKKAAEAIANEKAIAAQRKSFGTISSAMLKLTRELNLNSANVYVQYCPMVKKSWLNEVEAVQNPYYGSMMYDCGEVKETIAKK